MIFVTLGSQKFQFNRLIKAVDDLIEQGAITDNVFAQVGYSDYRPKNYRYEKFLNYYQYAEWEDKADVVITHGGTGAIIGAIKKGKKVIAVPRLAKYGEHVDDHQLQLIAQFRQLNLICGLRDCEELEKGLHFVKNHSFDTYESNTFRIINSIEKFIQEVVT